MKIRPVLPDDGGDAAQRHTIRAGQILTADAGRIAGRQALHLGRPGQCGAGRDQPARIAYSPNWLTNLVFR